jgi:hypothetical protein
MMMVLRVERSRSSIRDESRVFRALAISGLTPRLERSL